MFLQEGLSGYTLTLTTSRLLVLSLDQPGEEIVKEKQGKRRNRNKQGPGQREGTICSTSLSLSLLLSRFLSLSLLHSPLLRPSPQIFRVKFMPASERSGFNFYIIARGWVEEVPGWTDFQSVPG